MINYVIKADGTKEEFNPEKLNRWAEFASEFDISWSELALKSYRKCFDGCTTEDLHNAMISACVDAETAKHFAMGGRLLCASVYKEAFGGFKNIPSLKELYHKLVASGHWAKMDYTEEELEYLNTIIDHDKDLHYNLTSVRQMKDKYLIKDRIANKVLESPQFMFMGMAMQNMEKMPKERRLSDIAKLYQYLSDMKINLPTPMLVNMRTRLKGYASCCVYTTDDTIQSLAAGDHIAYTMTAASAGIGGYLKTRSKGDGVRSNTIKHLGKVPYYRLIESNVHANLQSSRGGACTTYFTVLDPEFYELIVLKNPMTPTQKQVRNIDYAVTSNRIFAEAVAKNKDWMLISYQEAPDLHEAMFKGDTEEFVQLYQYYLDKDCKKTMVKARDMMIKVLTESIETGRVYLFQADEANRHTPFDDKIYSSNLCVAPETLVLTDKGYLPIAELEGQNIGVWNGSEFSSVDVVKTGINQKLIKVVTDSGQELECTPYHKFYTQNTYRGKPVEVRAIDLKPGDKLVKFELPIVEGELTLEHPYDNGFYSGDGCYVARGNHQRIYLYHKKVELEKYLTASYYQRYNQENRVYLHTRDLKDKFFVPTADYTIKSRLDWLAGYLDADGTVYRNGTNEQLVATSINLQFLQNIQLMLQTLGVASKVTKSTGSEGVRLLPKNDGTGELGEYSCKQQWRLIIPSMQTYKLLSMGLSLHRLNLDIRKPQRDATRFIKVDAVIDEGRVDDTYCFTEPKRHMGMFNGILTGQCLEIALPTKPFTNVMDLYSENPEGEIGLCSLASIVTSRVSDEEYEDVAYYTALTIDNVIELMEYPFKGLEVTAKSRRSIGVGITDLAHDIAKNNLSYVTQEGKEYIHYVAERHSYWLHKASLRLAKERGVCSDMDSSKYRKGWLPIDTYNRAVDTITSKLSFDWETLRKEILEVGGLRNSVLEAHMPVESSSQLTNTTNGLYPIRNKKIIKSSGNNKNVLLAPEADRLVYDIAWDIDTKHIIDLYAIVQKFTGQAISADLYIRFSKEEKTVPTKKLLQDYLYMVKMGLKTRYYINTASGLQAKLTSEVVEDKGCGSGGCTL